MLKFKIGEKVKFVQDLIGDTDLTSYINKTAEIVDIDKEDNLYDIEFEDGYTISCIEDELYKYRKDDK